MRRKSTFILLIMTLIFSAFQLNVLTGYAAEDQENPTISALKYDGDYLLATVNEAIALADLTFNDAAISGEELVWTSASEKVTVSENEMIASEAGYYELTASKDDVTTNVSLLVKGAEDNEYVIYETDFADATDGELPEGWTETPASQGKSKVVDGTLIIDGTAHNTLMTGVLLPKYIEQFGDYTIEAMFTHEAVNDDKRWNSIMYRVQNNSFPYYQMAVRQNATAANGVEFAERTPEDKWNVAEKTSYTEHISADKMYEYKVVAKGNRVQYFINDDLLINTDIATKYDKGRVGLQTAGSKTKVSQIRVTLQAEELPPIPPKPGENFVNVSEPNSKISLAPSLVTEVKTEEDLEQLTAGALPATAILHVNDELNVTNERGDELADLAAVIAQMNEKVMPAFAIDNTETIEPLAAYLKAEGLEDAFVLSNKPELVKQMREAYPIIRGVVEMTGTDALDEAALMDIRRTVNSNLSKIVILPQEVATRENVAFLQRKLMTVWVKESADETSVVNKHRMITTGPNGMIVNSAEQAVEAFELYTNNTTFVRKPLIVGHRGIPGLAPENTLEGAKLAYEKGADIIENDVYLTKDGHVVIMHDATIDRTTTGTGKVEELTLEELRQYTANKQFPDKYPDAKIPTLEEFFEEFKGEDVDHFVETKGSNLALIEAVVELIEEHGVEDQVSIISFDAEQLKLLGKEMPGMSGGFLTSGVANEQNVNTSLRETLNIIQGYSTTFNTSYSGLGENFMEAAKHRGITFWPWTYRKEADFNKFLLLGTNGLTTDYAHWASDYASEIYAKDSSYSLKTGEKLAIDAEIKTYDRKMQEVTPDVVVIDGHDKVTVNGNEITAKEAGTVQALLRYTQEMSDGSKYDIYTEPITVTIEKKGSGGGSSGGGGGAGTGGSQEPEQPGTPEPELDKVIELDDKAMKVDVTEGTDGRNQAAVTLNMDEVEKQLHEKLEKLIIEIDANLGNLEAQLPLELILKLNKLNPNAVIEIKMNGAMFTLPVNEVDERKVLEELNAKMTEVHINAQLNELKDQGNQLNDAQLNIVSPMIDFELEAVANGKKLDLNQFTQYIERVITGTKSFNPDRSIVVRVHDDGSFQSVPTVFAGKDAMFKSMSNSKYVIVESKGKSFVDVPKGHWANEYVEKLAAKYMINGTSANKYSPIGDTTRAEFAALLTRALGLEATGEGGLSFTDVKGTEWFAVSGELQAAVEAGLIEGNANGTFAPNKAITRAEAATMISRALKFVSANEKMFDSTKSLSEFKDNKSIPVWAEEDVEKVLQAGIFTGDHRSNFNAQSFTKRQEVAKIIHHTLQVAEFMN